MLGGVWCWNVSDYVLPLRTWMNTDDYKCYPGARVDCEFPYYGYSDPNIWSTFTWTERYPSYKEIRRYFEHVDKVWDLSKDISLNTRVVEARFRDNGWDITTSAGDTHRSRWFIAATGTSARPYVPEFDGMGKFKGEVHHSSLWPDEPVDMKEKRVAVVGAGATGIQVSDSWRRHFVRTYEIMPLILILEN